MPLRGLENLGNQPKIAELVSGREKTILLLVPQTAMVLPSLHLGPPLPEYIPSLKTVVGTEWVLGTLYGRKEGGKGRREKQWNTLSFQYWRFTRNYKMPQQLSVI